MGNRFNMRQKAECKVTPGKKPRGVSGLNFNNHFTVEHWRDGMKIGEYYFKNDITDVGMNALLDIMFHGNTQITTWYVGLIDNGTFSALADGDTMSSHGGWTESTSYDEADRQEWTEGAASSRVITNASPMVFTISASVTIYGLFVTSDDTKGGTSGTLWATAPFSSPVALVDDDELRVTYSVEG